MLCTMNTNHHPSLAGNLTRRTVQGDMEQVPSCPSRVEKHAFGFWPRETTMLQTSFSHSSGDIQSAINAELLVDTVNIRGPCLKTMCIEKNPQIHPSNMEPTPIGPKEAIQIVDPKIMDYGALSSLPHLNSLRECLRPFLGRSPDMLTSKQPKDAMKDAKLPASLGNSKLYQGKTRNSVVNYMKNVHSSCPSSSSVSSSSSSNSLDGQPSNDASDDGEEAPGAVRFRASHLQQWDTRFNELVQFRYEKGHCVVPLYYPQNATLSHWVKRQRCQYKLKLEGKHSTLTHERQELLENLGFTWDSHNASWEERFHELCQYKEQHGHCNVPSNYSENPSLAAWIKCQRRYLRLFHRNSSSTAGNPKTTMRYSLSADRVKKLIKLGLRWKKNTKVSSATNMHQEL